MSEFKVGDRVITRWGEGLSHLPNKACVPEGVHTICEVFHENKKYVRLDTSGGWLYPISLMTKVDDAPAVEHDGGPAFPIWSGDMRDPQGMSLRDVCAMLAMQAFISGGDVRDNMFLSDPKGRELTQWLSEDSYAYADAMIKARKK